MLKLVAIALVSIATTYASATSSNQDGPMVAWCDALVTGHTDLGDTLPAHAPEDVELVRFCRLEAQDFRSALAVATPRQSGVSKAEAEQSVTAVKAQWASASSERASPAA